MKKVILLLLGVIIITIACHKSHSDTNSDCGCSSDSIKYTFINYNGTLGFDSIRNGWAVGTEFPSDNSYECKICNPSLPAVASLVNTLSKKDIMSVNFSGKLKKPCPGEINFFYIPEHQQFDITIDSLKRN